MDTTLCVACGKECSEEPRRVARYGMVCICSSSCAIALDARLSLRGLAGDTAAARRIEQVRDSHEALRDEVERLTKENERIKEWATLTIEVSDAVIAKRVEERDATRRMYCESKAGRFPDVSARQIAQDVWPDDADRLFPEEKR